MEFTDQHGYKIRFGWGYEDLAVLAPHCRVVVVVDVLRFTTAVSVAVQRGTHVLPYRWNDASAAPFAAANDAVLAGHREDGAPSLSPADLLTIPLPERLVLPSPNGSTLSLGAAELGAQFVLAGALRNATATARLAGQRSKDQPIAVIAAGERWSSPDALRPALEDQLGAGAIIAALVEGGIATDNLSPEALSAHAVFRDAERAGDLSRRVSECASGRELRQRGWADDVRIAVALDDSDVAAELRSGRYIPARA